MTTEQKSENLKTLLTMFPEVDSEICEAVLETNNSDLEASVNTLLGMTDPNYEPPPEEELMTSANTQTTGQQQLRTPLSTTRTTTTPSLPPRSSPLDPNATVIESRVFVTKEEQIRRDEELARRLAAEDQKYVEQHRATQQQRRRQRQEEEDQSSFPDFSEELPVIKEKIVQAADTTKKKVKEWYDKLKQQSVALRNEYVSGHDNNNDRNQNQSQHHYSNLPYDEFDNTLLDEDFTKSLDNSSNHHQNLNNFTGVSKDVKDSDNDNKIYSNSSGSNSGNKINNNNLRSSPLRSQQPVYGSYEIDLNNKKDSYSPFDNDRKGNDLITATSSSSSSSAIINNNIKSDNGTSSISKKNQQKSTSEFLPYSISVDNDDKNSEKEKKEKVKEEETDDKNLDKVFHEKLNITTKPIFSSITSSSSSSSSSSNNVITNTNSSKRENNGNIPLLDEDTKKE